jgi:hypothetical protein
MTTISVRIIPNRRRRLPAECGGVCDGPAAQGTASAAGGAECGGCESTRSPRLRQVAGGCAVRMLGIAPSTAAIAAVAAPACEVCAHHAVLIENTSH